MKKMDAYRIHLIRSALDSLGASLIWTAMMTYQVQVVGLTPLQLVLVGTTMETAVFLFEIPTGIVADVYSRRLSCIIGFFILGIAYLVQGAYPAFAVLLLGNVLWGVGYTFTSGAYSAWLVDEIGQDRAGNAFIRGGQVGQLAGLVGIVLSMILGVIHLQLPIVFGAIITGSIAVIMLVFMPETGFTPVPAQDRTTFQKMWDTFRAGVGVIRSRPRLMSILAVGIFFGLFSEGWDRLWEAHLITTFNVQAAIGIPQVVIRGILNLSLLALSVTALEVLRRRIDTNNLARLTSVVFLLTAVMVGAVIGYGIAPSLIAAIGLWYAFNIARALIEPLLATWTNGHVDSNVRATVLSMQSQVDAIGQMVGGPPVGLIGQTSLRAAFVASGLILSPALFLLQRVRRREAADAVAAPAAAP